MFTNALKSFSSNIASNYEKSAAPVSTCGPWKIYDAKKKKTNQPVSIFVFERKSLENPSSSSSSSSGFGGSSRGGSSKDGLKAAQEEVVERLKKEAGMLARLRHPCVLELVEPVEETRGGGLQFVAEPVTGSLATLLREKDEEERSGGGRYVQNDDGRRRRREVEIDELEIQKGLLQVGKALEFLHESANLIHGNLTPDAVIVNAKSDWKICSLGFAVNSTSPQLPPQFDPRLPANVQLQLDYAAPDLMLDQTLTTSCDLFSLGMLIVALYNHPHNSPLETHNSAPTYRRLLNSAQTTPNAGNSFLSSRPLPRQLTSSVLPQLITRRPASRMTARAFQESEYFDNILVSTLRFLDQFPAKTPSEKAAFMRGLQKILPQFPKSVLEKKILPGLVEELRDGSLLALVLPNIFQIAESASSRLFSEKVLKRLKEVFIPPGGAPASSATSEPKSAAAKIAERDREAGKEGGLTVILSRLALIKEKTTAQEFKEDILPLVFLALESPTHALQDVALRSLSVIMPKLDFPTLKNDLFPVVAAVFTKTSSLGIKIRGLEAFKVLCGGKVSDSLSASDGLDGLPIQQKGKVREDAPVLDKYTVQEKVIPLLKGIKTKEPAVMMEALAVFDEIGKTCDREVVAMDILPTLWTMSFGPLLGLEQFKAFMSSIKSLSQKIEAEQIRKLQELSSSGTTGQSAGEFLSFGGAPGLHTMNGRASPSVGSESDFERLVLGKKDVPANDGGFAWQSSATPASSNGFSTPATSTTASVPARVRSPQPPITTTGAQKFSWSTPSPTVTQPTVPSMGSVLAPSQPAFPAMQPTGVGRMSAPLQPSAGGFGSTTAFRSTSPTPQASSYNTGGGIDWTAAAKPKPSFPANNSNVSGSTLSMNQRSALTPTPTMTPSMNQMMSNLNFGGSSAASTSGFGTASAPAFGGSSTGGIKKGGGIQLANFGAPLVPKPATSTLQASTFATNTGSFSIGVKKPEEQKQGLDAWESLI